MSQVSGKLRCIAWEELEGLGLVLIYLSRYLDQETAKGPFRFSSQAATYYYQSNHSKVEVIPLSALPKGTTSEFASLIFTQSLFFAERQAGKL